MNELANLSNWFPLTISKRTAQSSPSPELLGSPSDQAVYLKLKIAQIYMY